MEKVMEYVKTKKVLALVGLIALLLGTFLPYFKVSVFGFSRTIALWGYWEGKIVFVLTLANALFIFKDFIQKYVPQLFNNAVGALVEKANNPKFSLVPTILVALFAIYMLVSIEIDTTYIKYGLGFYTLWLGILALIGHAVFYKGEGSVATVAQPMVQPQMAQPVQQMNTVQPTQPQMAQPVQPMNTVQPTQPQMAQPQVKVCPYCGNQCAVTDNNCFMCGKQI